MKYYVWLNAAEQPVSKAWPYEDETERMAAKQDPPCAGAVLHAGTREQLIERYSLSARDFID
jgi:hypothetical protein